MATQIDKIHNGILRKFHTLCTLNGLSEDEKRAIVNHYGVTSSADIDTHDLINICAALSKQADGGRGNKMDKLRKQAMASIGGWLKAAGYKSNAEVIKSIACRASGYDSFNKIPVGRLHNLYHNFRNKQIDKIAAESLMREIVGSRVEIAPQSNELPN